MDGSVVEVTRQAELRALLRAAVTDVTPAGGSGFLRARSTSKVKGLRHHESVYKYIHIYNL